MPPRSSLTGSFSVTDANNEVVCPLKNNDGSNCRKRCLGVSRLFPPKPLLSLKDLPTTPAKIASSTANYLCPKKEKGISVSCALI